jgi:hypothetical protein
MRQQKTIENEVAEVIVFRINTSRIAATMKIRLSIFRLPEYR